MKRNFITDFRKGGDFLKSYWARWSRKQVAIFHVRSLKGAESNICTCKPRSWELFLDSRVNQIKWYSLILTQNRQILKLSLANGVTKQVTVRAWWHEPGWLALPRWLLSWYYMKRASPEPLFLYRDWKQCAWVVCYPRSCFLLTSFSRPPGICDNLENFHPGSRHHNAGIPANRADSVVI